MRDARAEAADISADGFDWLAPGRDVHHDLGPTLIGKRRVGAPLRPVGDADRDDPARARQRRRPVHAADRPGLTARRGGHPAALRRAHRGGRPFAADPRPAQPAPAGLAAGRAVRDRAVLRDAVRRRRPRRAARRDQAGSAACSPSRARSRCGTCPPAGGTRRTRSRSGCCSTPSSRRAGRGPRWLAGSPAPRSASSRWCCSRCRCCSRLLPWRRMPAVPRPRGPAVRRCCSARRRWPTGTTRTPSVTSQPNSPVDQPPDRVDVAGPAHVKHERRGRPRSGSPRSCSPACCALAVRRRWLAQAETAEGGPWPPSLLADVLWWVALALALRSFFEPVMVSYYPWPLLAVALIPAATLGWIRLVAAVRARGRPDRARPRARRTASGSGGSRWSSASPACSPCPGHASAMPPTGAPNSLRRRAQRPSRCGSRAGLPAGGWGAWRGGRRLRRCRAGGG